MNPIEAYVVLGLTIAGFVVIGVLALTVLRRAKYPKGKRLNIAAGPYGKIAVVVDPALLVSTSVIRKELPVAYRMNAKGEEVIVRCIDPGKHKVLAEACKKAVEVAGIAWREYDGVGVDPHEELKDFCFHFPTDKDYEAAWKGHLKPLGLKTAAVRGQLPQGVGSGPLAAMIRGSLIDRVIETGSPAVHEVFHGLDKWNSFHTNPPPPTRDGKVWREKGVPDEETAEGRAYGYFKETS